MYFSFKDSNTLVYPTNNAADSTIVYNITYDLTSVHSDITNIKNDLTTIQNTINDITNNLYYDITNIKNDFTNLKIDFTNLYNDLTTVIQNAQGNNYIPDNITLEVYNGKIRVKNQGITVNQLAYNIDASQIGFNADKVDGKHANDSDYGSL